MSSKGIVKERIRDDDGLSIMADPPTSNTASMPHAHYSAQLLVPCQLSWLFGAEITGRQQHPKDIGKNGNVEMY
jgi:hypothetical protein